MPEFSFKLLKKVFFILVVLSVFLVGVWIYLKRTGRYSLLEDSLIAGLANTVVRVGILKPPSLFTLTEPLEGRRIKYVNYSKNPSAGSYLYKLNAQVVSNTGSGSSDWLSSAWSLAVVSNTGQAASLALSLGETKVFWDVGLMAKRPEMEGALIKGGCSGKFCQVVFGGVFIKAGDVIDIVWETELSPQEAIVRKVEISDQLTVLLPTSIYVYE